MDERAQELEKWLCNDLKLALRQLTPLAGDASFRRYFRAHMDTDSYVVMDIPPALEDSQSFINVAHSFAQLGVKVPNIIAADTDAGFLLLDDFGDQLYSTQLSDATAERLYHQAIDALLTIQTYQADEHYVLPAFDKAFMLMEMGYFSEWFLGHYLQLDLSTAEVQLLNTSYELLSETILQQPTVCVHRDYHSRNLMLLASGEVGVIDFQDAVWGPITYDLISLFKDCYVRWPRHNIETWLHYYYVKASEQGMLANCDWQQFLTWFEWMGIQRHLKVVGIFSRLYFRDNKENYLRDIPLGLDYLTQALASIPELATLSNFIQQRVLPIYEKKAIP